MCDVSDMIHKHGNDNDDDDDDDDDSVEFNDSSQPMTSQLALVARQPSVAKQPVPPTASAANHNVHTTRHRQVPRPVMSLEYQLITLYHVVISLHGFLTSFSGKQDHLLISGCGVPAP